MADFCNKCAPKMWSREVDPDIDVHRIAEELETGHFESVLCEGCNIRAVGKTDRGEIIIAILEEEGSVEDMVRWIPLNEWLELETSI